MREEQRDRGEVMILCEARGTGGCSDYICNQLLSNQLAVLSGERRADWSGDVSHSAKFRATEILLS